jgi:hypothetical protein
VTQPKRPDAVDQLLAKVRERRSRHARALQIAHSSDPEDRKRLLVIAEKVAQVHPGFAKDLLVLVERAVREHEAIAKNLEALCADPADGATKQTNETN